MIITFIDIVYTIQNKTINPFKNFDNYFLMIITKNVRKNKQPLVLRPNMLPTGCLHANIVLFDMKRTIYRYINTTLPRSSLLFAL